MCEQRGRGEKKQGQDFQTFRSEAADPNDQPAVEIRHKQNKQEAKGD